MDLVALRLHPGEEEQDVCKLTCPYMPHVDERVSCKMDVLIDTAHGLKAVGQLQQAELIRNVSRPNAPASMVWQGTGNS